MKVFLRIYYWIVFALSLFFELISSLMFIIFKLVDFLDDIVDFFDDKLLKHLMDISKKIDE